MRKITRKVLSLALALVMCLALLPTAALAVGQEYYPKTGTELESLFSNNNKIPGGSTVYLEAKTYQISNCLYIENMSNLSIIGLPGTKLILDNGYDTVIYAEDCAHLTLGNLTMGHNQSLTFPEGCTDGVMEIADSNVVMMDCDLFGCGVHGIGAYDSDITLDHCTIRDCSSYAMVL